ncbi:MAG TPA: aminotransferase class V-fold PLP-dependent enzyme [Opitutaceae bacterium]|nr:aminotransferase class V-fold PLP-dependent enzyme [Opitutaceae bacterium]
MRKIGAVPYFDHNATTPLAPVAREVWLRTHDRGWQNPSSLYGGAARVRMRLEAARTEMARLLGAEAERLVFTSGATEGANAICAHLARTLPLGARVAVNPTEHPCMLEAAKFFLGDRIVWLEVSRDGIVAPRAVDNLLAAGGLGAVIVMAVNNETGVLQPWRELARTCRRHAAAFVCDATQWLGKLPADGLGAADWVIGSAHKFGGPKGVGLLLMAGNQGGFHLLRGGEQEHGRRAGTEDFPGVAAMTAEFTEIETKKVLLETERRRWRDEFERAVAVSLPGVEVVGAGADRLWNTVSLIMPHGENTRWVSRLDKHGFQVSTGSACATGHDGPSHVLAAMRFSPERARRAVRVSAGWETMEADWQKLAEVIATVSAEVTPSEAVAKL